MTKEELINQNNAIINEINVITQRQTQLRDQVTKNMGVIEYLEEQEKEAKESKKK